MIMQNYLPATEGTAYEVTQTLSALEPYREHFQILSGLNSMPSPGRPGGAPRVAQRRVALENKAGLLRCDRLHRSLA